MRKAEIEEYIKSGNYTELAEKLEAEAEDEYDEYSMLSLAKAYLALGNEKSAKKIVRRLKMLYPAGEYLTEADELLQGADRQTPAASSPQRDSAPKQKTGVKIVAGIEELFRDVVGLENVKKELSGFYQVLWMYNEKVKKGFQVEQKYTNFAVAGARGSGKSMVSGIIAGMLCEFGVRNEDQVIQIEARELIAAGEKGVYSRFEKWNDATVTVENVDELLKDEKVAAGIIHALEKQMRSGREHLSVILTGSIQALDKIKAMNETLEDVLYATVSIEPYSPLELLKIAEHLAQADALLIKDDARKALLKKIQQEYRGNAFMNAISLKRYLDEAVKKMAARCYMASGDGHASEEAMVYLMPEDFETESGLGQEGLEELLAELDALPGLSNVKAKIKKQVRALQVAQDASRAGANRREGNGTLHMIFEGNAGTGKTTVARMMGKIYQQMGILPRGSQLVECSRSDLVGQHLGQTAPLVKAKVKEALGGVLFIDEAYAICRDHNDRFGLEAVDQLIKEMEDNRDNLMVIMAGYTAEMNELLKMNSGFSSRIPRENHILFEDYTPEEMVEIFLSMVKKDGMRLEPEAEKLLPGMIETKSRVPGFDNARGLRNLLQEVKGAQDARLQNASMEGVQLGKEEYDLLKKEDIQLVTGRKSSGEKTLEELLEELDGLIGLASVKAKVHGMVDEMRIQKYLGGNGHGTLHMIFQGNAGTGKTTVARLIGQIYAKLGVLRKGAFLEVTRSDLVGQYMGETAKNVVRKVKEAEGGILFIDEVYNLVNGERDTYGLEAVNTLVPEIENRKDDLMVIIAGYGENMKNFLETNQGLASRFPNEITFEDYSDEELVTIFRSMAKQNGIDAAEELHDTILSAIRKKKAEADNFGNARGVRNLLDKVRARRRDRVIVPKLNELEREGRSKQEIEEILSMLAATLEEDDFALG